MTRARECDWQASLVGSMSGNNSVHPGLGEKEPTLIMKETKTYKSTIANPGLAYVFPQ